MECETEFCINVPGAAAEVDEESNTLQTIEERFCWLVAEGSEDRSGGCTDAAMRMTNLLKVFFSLYCVFEVQGYM